MIAPIQIAESVPVRLAEAQRQRGDEVSAICARVCAIQDRFRTLPVQGSELTDADLYDEEGGVWLPRAAQASESEEQRRAAF